MTSKQFLAANESGQLTPDLLREFYKVDPINASRVLKQKQNAKDMDYIAEFMEILNSEPGTESTSTNSGYKMLSDKFENFFGADDDDGFVASAAKGLGDAVASPIRLGAAATDYATAAVNDLILGNETGIQNGGYPRSFRCRR